MPIKIRLTFHGYPRYNAKLAENTRNTNHCEQTK